MSDFICRCGCGRPVTKNNSYWATEECGKRGRKLGVYMPASGEWRKTSRLIRKTRSLRKMKGDE